MKYSVNVDSETRNRAGASTDCRAHPEAAEHFDITVHVAGCSPSARVERPPKRYWKDFATVEEAMQFANDRAARPGVELPHPVRVRSCQRCMP